MCFSAQASFTAGTLLMFTGTASVVHAKRVHSPLWVLAALPLLFGVQQMLEGGVWLALAAQSALWTRALSLAFLFFAFFLWPLYCPLAVLPAEAQHRKRHAALLGLMLCGGVLGALIYIPVLTGQVGLTTQIMDRCISYQTDRASELKHVYTLLYLGLTVMPFAFSSHNSLRFFAVLLLLSIGLAAYFYTAAFFSVWCFFAAVLSVYIAWTLRPRKHPTAPLAAAHLI